MIIFGWRGVTFSAGSGSFFCPSCADQRDFDKKSVRQFFTLYFIPIIPASLTGGASSPDAIVTNGGASMPISQPTPRWYRSPMAAANGEPAPCPR